MFCRLSHWINSSLICQLHVPGHTFTGLTNESAAALITNRYYVKYIIPIDTINGA